MNQSKNNKISNYPVKLALRDFCFNSNFFSKNIRIVCQKQTMFDILIRKGAFMQQNNNKKDDANSQTATPDVKFSMDAVDQTWTTYRLNQVLDGVVVLKREDGVIFNIGGKSDGFIPADDFDNFADIQVGDRFKVVITNMKNEEGLLQASKRRADALLIGTMQAKELKLGSVFSFVATKIVSDGLQSKLGEYTIFVPNDEISNRPYKSKNIFLNKRLEGIVTEIDNDKKNIVASCKMLAERQQLSAEKAFWNSIFVNKLVEGKVEKIMPYGAFVNVNGITCLCHISDISYNHINSPDEVLKLGQTYVFKVKNVDRENQKVGLSYKALQQSPKALLLDDLSVGEKYIGEVIKFMPFGAILQLENGAEGLLHIKDATNLMGVNIYEIVKMGEKVEVVVKAIDKQKNRLSFELEIKA